MTATAIAPPRPDEGGRERSSEAGTVNRLKRARAELQRLQAQPGFDPDLFTRWGHLDFADRFGIDPFDALRLCRELETQQQATGYTLLKEWHDQLLIHSALSATEKVAALRVWSFVNHQHLYAWPSQDRLAKELGYSRGPNLGKALRRSFEIGAYSPVRVKNLPSEIRELAVNQSRRSLRGIAYRLNPVRRWPEEAATFSELQNSNMFRGGTLECSVAHHLNIEENHLLASPDFSSLSVRASPLTFQRAETSQYGSDGG